MTDTLEIPYGTRDALPAEARQNRLLKNHLSNLFSGFGYREVTTPALEYTDTLTRGDTEGDLEESLFKISGIGRGTALRHEMTTPLARLAVSRLSGSPLPLKLFYIADVWRFTKETQAGRQCEFCQAGVELTGSPYPAADAEVIALCVMSMKKGGLKNFRLSLGSVAFVRATLESLNIEERRQIKLKHALEKRDLVRFDAEINTLNLAEGDAQKLRRLPYLIGKEEILAECGAMAKTATAKAAVDNLSEIYRLLGVYGVADDVFFDMGLIRDFDYYTGAVFEVYADGFGFPISGGGRYDTLLAAFGENCPATGFSLGLDRLLIAKAQQGDNFIDSEERVYVGYVAHAEKTAINRAADLRNQNEHSAVEIAFAAQTEEEAAQTAKERGCRLVYCR